MKEYLRKKIPYLILTITLGLALFCGYLMWDLLFNDALNNLNVKEYSKPLITVNLVIILSGFLLGLLRLVSSLYKKL